MPSHNLALRARHLPRLSLTLLQRFTLVGLTATAACAIAIGVAATRYEVADQLDHFAQKAALTATYLLAPTVSAADFEVATPAGVLAWDERMKRVLGRTEILRIKVFSPDGTLVYSDEPALIGQKVDLAEGHEFREALGGVVAAEVGEGRRVDKSGAVSEGPLLEVYVPVFQAGTERVIGVYEVYQDYAPIAALTRRIHAIAWLASSLAFAVLFLSLFAVVRAASRQLVFMAYHDPLTGVANRHRLREALEGALRAEFPDTRPALLYVDLSRFKAVNDSFGHKVGDELLRQVAARLSGALGEDELLARVGGDEFVVLLPRTRVEHEAVQRAELLLAAMRDAFTVRGQTLHVGASIGIAMYSSDGGTWEDLITRADTAMYRAKQAGVGVESYRPQMVRYTRERLELEEDLTRAVQEGAIRLVYQPIVSLPEGAVTGAEALARWDDSRRGPVPPSVFIPVAEETGLIRLLDRCVIERAIAQAATWSAGGTPLRVAVNVSAATFAEASFTDFVASTLRELGLPAALLTLEITERVLLDGDSTRESLETLSRLGVNIALDDFGTGYSSLSYIQTLPIDVIKIDRSFVQQLDTTAGGDAIVRTIIGLANNLGVSSLAEGIEEPRQLAWLAANGCTYGQGYYLGRPIAPDALIALANEGAVFMAATPHAEGVSLSA